MIAFPHSAAARVFLATANEAVTEAVLARFMRW
jgi:hypothetical protein